MKKVDYDKWFEALDSLPCKLFTQYAPIYDKDGAYLGSTCSIVDISGR